MLSSAAGGVALCQTVPLALSLHESAVSIPDTRGQDETGNGSPQPEAGQVSKASAGQAPLALWEGAWEHGLGGRAGEGQRKWLFSPTTFRTLFSTERGAVTSLENVGFRLLWFPAPWSAAGSEISVTGQSRPEAAAAFSSGFIARGARLPGGAGKDAPATRPQTPPPALRSADNAAPPWSARVLCLVAGVPGDVGVKPPLPGGLPPAGLSWLGAGGTPCAFLGAQPLP